jgi:hypothetical protein
MEKQNMVPAYFQPLETPLPPMLMNMAEVTSTARFIGLWFQVVEPVWTDGLSFCDFSERLVWSPLMDFLVIEEEDLALYRNFGQNQPEALHMLMCDRQKRRMYFCTWDDGREFLKRQYSGSKVIPLRSQRALDLSDIESAKAEVMRKESERCRDEQKWRGWLSLTEWLERQISLKRTDLFHESSSGQYIQHRIQPF